MGRSTGLIGSIVGRLVGVNILGVDPVGFVVHFVPLPVEKRGCPWDIGVLGRLGRAFTMFDAIVGLGPWFTL